MKGRPETAVLVSEDWVWSSWATGRLMDPSEFPVPTGPAQDVETAPPVLLSGDDISAGHVSPKSNSSTSSSTFSALALAYSPPSPEPSAAPAVIVAEELIVSTHFSPPKSPPFAASEECDRDANIHLPTTMPVAHKKRVELLILALRKWSKRGSLLVFLRDTGITSAPNLYYQHRQCIHENVPGLSERVYAPDVDSDDAECEGDSDAIRLPKTIPKHHKPRVRAIIQALHTWNGRGSLSDFLRRLPITSALRLYYQHHQTIAEHVPGLLERRDINDWTEEGSGYGEDLLPLPATVPLKHTARVWAIILALRRWDKRAFHKFIKGLDVPNAMALFYLHRQCIEDRVPGLSQLRQDNSDLQLPVESGETTETLPAYISSNHAPRVSLLIRKLKEWDKQGNLTSFIKSLHISSGLNIYYRYRAYIAEQVPGLPGYEAKAFPATDR